MYVGTDMEATRETTGMRDTETGAGVLVVDDNQELAGAYAATLGQHYQVQTAYGGYEALDVIDETVDVVLLDRRMPSMSGDQVLERIQERDLDCRVIVVTAVDPDFDIVEMPFDEHLHKPVRGEELIDAIERQLEIYDECTREFVALTSKIEALEQTKSIRELQNNQHIEALREQVAELETCVDASVQATAR
jgi:DNA-binding NtrC family response regulator